MPKGSRPTGVGWLLPARLRGRLSEGWFKLHKSSRAWVSWWFSLNLSKSRLRLFPVNPKPPRPSDGPRRTFQRCDTRTGTQTRCSQSPCLRNTCTSVEWWDGSGGGIFRSFNEINNNNKNLRNSSVGSILMKVGEACGRVSPTGEMTVQWGAAGCVRVGGGRGFLQQDDPPKRNSKGDPRN